MSRLLDTLKSLFSTGPSFDEAGNNAGNGESPAAVDETSAKKLMQLMETTNPGEFSCDETFDLLDEYVELVNDDRQAAAIMPYVKQHLEHCVDCRERYETLLAILQTA